jgi:hypothetical protein
LPSASPLNRSPNFSRHRKSASYTFEGIFVRFCDLLVIYQVNRQRQRKVCQLGQLRREPPPLRGWLASAWLPKALFLS